MKVAPLGAALASFFAITYTICVLWGLATPVSMHMHQVWAPMMPGFKWISGTSYFVGLGWSILYGFYVALVFAPLYNFFSGWAQRS